MSDTENWIRVAAAADVPQGEMLAVDVGRAGIAIYHLDDGSWHATDNECTHEFALLTDGWLEGCEIECPLHAGRFDVRDGKALCAPVSAPVKVYPVRVDGDAVMVQIAAS